MNHGANESLLTQAAAWIGGLTEPAILCGDMNETSDTSAFIARFFRDIPDLLGDGPGIFPIRPFSLSRPIKSTYEEQS